MTPKEDHCYHCAAYYMHKAGQVFSMAPVHKDWHGYISFVEPVEVILARHGAALAQYKVYFTNSFEVSPYYQEHLDGIR